MIAVGEILGISVDSETLSYAVIPVIAGIIGYGTNWVAVKMLFWPLRFIGVRVPLLKYLATLLPRRIQQIPGLLEGGIGWQGLIPSRAAKMGSIAVDKGISKLGSPSEFYEKLEPEKMAEQILATARKDIRDLVERVLEREHPGLWRDTPAPIKQAVHARVQQQLPEIIREATEDIGPNIEHLMDVKLMVIRHIEENPYLANRIFLEVGEKELKFIVNSGLYFGFLLGLPQIPLFATLGYWFILPLGGVIVGYLTNWLALRIIFEPYEPRKVGPIKIQGLFMRRRVEVADIYSKVIAEDVVNMANMGEELLHGPQSDRTRRLIQTRLRPAVDRAFSIAKPAVRVAVGTREYDAMRRSFSAEGVEYMMTPLIDPDFNTRQSAQVRELLRERMHGLPNEDFADLLRSAFQEDEWMLILLGAVLGFIAGLAQVALLF